VDDLRWLSRLAAVLTIAVSVWLVEQLVPLVQMFGDILLLFFLAWLIAFILDPIATAMERWRVRRALAVLSIYVALLVGLALIGLIIGPLVIVQLGQLAQGLPQLVSSLPTQQELTHFLAGLGLPTTDLSSVYQPNMLAQQLQSAAGPLVQGALAVATSALTTVVNLLLVLIISFYMLLDGRRIVWNILRVTPAQRRGEVILFLSQLSSSFGGFLRGQVIQAVLFGLYVAAIMAALRLSFVAVAALACAILMLIPIIGPVLSLIPPVLAALGESTTATVTILALLIPVHFMIINFVTPRIMGSQVGVSPLLVFLAILAGLRIAGPLGAFFGIPVMGVIVGMATILYNRWRAGEDLRKQHQARESGVAPDAVHAGADRPDDGT